MDYRDRWLADAWGEIYVQYCEVFVSEYTVKNQLGGVLNECCSVRTSEDHVGACHS